MKLFLKIELITIVLGILGGLGLFLALKITPTTSWEYIAKVPEIPAELVYANPLIYLKTATDSIYACTVNSRICEPMDSFEAPQTTSQCGEADNTPPTPPGTVVLSTASRKCLPDGYLETHLIVLDDLRLWKWEKFYMTSDYIAIVLAVVGAVAGTIVGVPYFVLSYIRLRLRGDEKTKRF